MFQEFIDLKNVFGFNEVTPYSKTFIEPKHILQICELLSHTSLKKGQLKLSQKTILSLKILS